MEKLIPPITEKLPTVHLVKKLYATPTLFIYGPLASMVETNPSNGPDGAGAGDNHS